VFYQLLTGSRPFNAASTPALLELIKGVEVRPPRQIDRKIPRELERICLRALSKRVTDRYNSAGDMAEENRIMGRVGEAQAAPNSANRFDGFRPPVSVSQSRRDRSYPSRAASLRGG